MWQDIQQFQDYSSLQKKVFMADRNHTIAQGIGSLILYVKQEGGRTRTVTVTNVLHTPELSANLLSVSSLTAKGAEIQFSAKQCSIYLKGVELETASRTGSLYNLQLAKTSCKANVASTEATMELWHRRLAHLGADNVKKLVPRSTGINLQLESSSTADSSTCQGCVFGKQTKIISRTPQRRATNCMELLYTDIGRPITPPSVGGANYYVTFTDDFSRTTWIYFLKAKDECLGRLKELTRLLQTETGLKVKRIRSDNRGEYSSNASKDFYSQKGIQWEPTVPYAPEQDRVSERVNRPLKDRTRSVLAQTQLPKALWAKITNTLVYLKNRSPTTANKDSKTLWEIQNSRKPALGHLKALGCAAYHHLSKPGQKKLDSCSQRCYLLGFEGSNQYRLWDPVKETVLRSRDVVFNESNIRYI